MKKFTLMAIFVLAVFTQNGLMAKKILKCGPVNPTTTEAPTVPPTPAPTAAPTLPPTPPPTAAPTVPPTPAPTAAPTVPPPPACGTYVPFNIATDFNKVAQNGVDPLGISQYVGRVNYTAPSGCAKYNPNFAVFSNTTTQTSYICDDKSHPTSFEYLLNSSRYTYVPMTTNQTDPCLTPGAIIYFGTSCYGKTVDVNGTTEFGTFQQDLKHVFRLFFFKDDVATFAYDNYSVLTCN